LWQSVRLPYVKNKKFSGRFRQHDFGGKIFSKNFFGAGTLFAMQFLTWRTNRANSLQRFAGIILFV
jgi:hypothetical protein